MGRRSPNGELRENQTVRDCHKRSRNTRGCPTAFYETAGGVKIKLVLMLVLFFCLSLLRKVLLLLLVFDFPQAFISGFYSHSSAPMGAGACWCPTAMNWALLFTGRPPTT